MHGAYEYEYSCDGRWESWLVDWYEVQCNAMQGRHVERESNCCIVTTTPDCVVVILCYWLFPFLLQKKHETQHIRYYVDISYTLFSILCQSFCSSIHDCKLDLVLACHSMFLWLSCTSALGSNDSGYSAQTLCITLLSRLVGD